MSRIRVLVADDHSGSRALIRSLLDAEFDVVGTVADGIELLDACACLSPDVVVTDVDMPNLDGIRATEQIRLTHSGLPVVLLTIHTSDALAAVGRRAGACEIVAKATASDRLAVAVRRAYTCGASAASQAAREEPRAAD